MTANLTEGLSWGLPKPCADIAEQASQAARRYSERVGGAVADTVHAHPSQLFAHSSLTVIADPRVLQGTLWVGRASQTPAPAAAPPARHCPTCACGDG
jgi:hypothetical protein